MTDQPHKPTCFGRIDIVFPIQPDGLRQTPEACMRCVEKTPCLRAAMTQPHGLAVREEMIDRAYRGGVIGFFQRWAQKKSIHQMKQKQGGAGR
ncbi:MAG: hypothetical protein HKP58_19510 [Desulfatitalea sp.]|nr:hypothetical protein [Desulfatitalea sp.]NNK02604.1 hypothetical protein [Desulfatitalea sp.]